MDIPVEYKKFPRHTLEWITQILTACLSLIKGKNQGAALQNAQTDLAAVDWSAGSHGRNNFLSDTCQIKSAKNLIYGDCPNRIDYGNHGIQ